MSDKTFSLGAPNENGRSVARAQSDGSGLPGIPRERWLDRMAAITRKAGGEQPLRLVALALPIVAAPIWFDALSPEGRTAVCSTIALVLANQVDRNRRRRPRAA
ncbi:hypothetical protein [Actinokineospora sp. NBRC 105648]|uniref:hypothetical protein n=1 Tax=Actinokineospora sp. NBRC 105648 TaxID=3032206 RepID=UPI0024A01A98|nr:hypothetical protein [Actinokineospora sp. NBRC 105648]GLZ39154.1 hypothetical protein Acsp05_27780 [Actinokineospora sp. NBRC 105648]